MTSRVFISPIWTEGVYRLIVDVGPWLYSVGIQAGLPEGGNYSSAFNAKVAHDRWQEWLEEQGDGKPARNAQCLPRSNRTGAK